MFKKIFLIIAIIFILMLLLKDNLSNPKTKMLDYPQMETPQKSDESLDTDLHSSNAVLVNLDENKILLDKNSEEIIYPASLTKIMTVLVAIENIPELNEKVLLPQSIFADLYKKMLQWQASLLMKK